MIHVGDCYGWLKTLPDHAATACVTDPPYGLCFMNASWDYDIPPVDVWREVLRVLKPGGMLLSFGGTRTFHRIAVAVEDAGFQIRDTIMYMYGSGFPKSHNVSKGIDKALGAEREVVCENPNARPIDGAGSGYSDPTGHDPYITAPATPQAARWEGYGSALKPSYEPILVAMKPLHGTYAQNALRHGVAGLNIDGTRIGTERRINRSAASNEIYGQFNGAEDDGRPCAGRWPPNLILGDDETAATLDAQSGDTPSRFFYTAKPSRSERERGLEHFEPVDPHEITGRKKGSAGQMSPYAGVTGETKRKNIHSTVKPLALMRYLIRLVTMPTGTVILEPYAGSGTTLVACVQEEVDFLACELSEEYAAIAQARVDHERGLPKQGVLF